MLELESVKGGFNVANFNVLFSVALLLDMQGLDEHLIGRLKGFEAAKKGEMRDYLRAETEVRLQGLCRKNPVPKRSELFGAILGAVNNTVDAFKCKDLTASEKVKYLIISRIVYPAHLDIRPLPYPCTSAFLAEEWAFWAENYPRSIEAATEEVRSNLGHNAHCPVPYYGKIKNYYALRRDYEHYVKACVMPDDTAVGWVYWSDQGFDGTAEPQEIKWIEYAFDLDVKIEEVTKQKYEFSLPERP